MGTFNVSLKTLTERVSLEVVYTPKELDQINVCLLYTSDAADE